MSLNLESVAVGAIGGLLGSGGLFGIFVFVLKHYIQKKLNERDEKEKERAALRLERSQIERELWHALGRLQFWLHRAIVTDSHNGELEKAFEEFQAAEEKSKALDTKILAMHEEDKK